MTAGLELHIAHPRAGFSRARAGIADEHERVADLPLEIDRAYTPGSDNRVSRKIVPLRTT